MQKKRASMHDGPLADLFRQTDASRDVAPEPVAAVEAPARLSKPLRAIVEADRKSTRLNSSHG